VIDRQSDRQTDGIAVGITALCIAIMRPRCKNIAAHTCVMKLK